MAYNKSSKRKSKYAIGAPKGKTPSRSCNLRKGVLFSAYGPSAIRQATCRCSRTLHLLRRTEQKKKYTPLGNTPLLPSLVDWAGRAAGLLYHIIRQKDTGNEAECQSLSLWERWHAAGVTERASPSPKSCRVAISRLFVGAILSRSAELFGSILALSGAPRQLPQRGSPWQAGQLPTGRLRPDMAQKGGPCYRGQHLLDKRTLSSCRESWQRSTTVPETSCFARPAWA